MKTIRKIIEIDDELCTGCGDCVPDCAEGSLKIVNGKAKLVADNLCDGLGACLKSCPTGALKIIEREADGFDEEAVHAFLADKEQQLSLSGSSCPSAKVESFAAAPFPAVGKDGGQNGSSLTHWPVQIRLVPPTASFLDECDLLVVADCAAVSYPRLNEDFIRDRVVLMGCPKFDDAQSYVDRFTEIFRTKNINSLTVLIMVVPCCAAMMQIVGKALDSADSTLSTRQVVVSTRGQILSNQTEDVSH